MEHRKVRIAQVLVVAATLLLLGCGSDPGADYIVGDTKNSQLPISGASAKLKEAFDLFKNGAYTQARELFVKIVGDSASASDKAEAYAGEGFCDVRLKGSQDGISEFEQALATDSKNQDARVGLAGALTSRGTASDILRAIDLLKGIDPGNAEFTYTDTYGIGITNAEVHALLGYDLFISGDTAGSNTQIGIAKRLDPNFANTNVGQIVNVISFIP